MRIRACIQGEDKRGRRATLLQVIDTSHIPEKQRGKRVSPEKLPRVRIARDEPRETAREPRHRLITFLLGGFICLAGHFLINRSFSLSLVSFSPRLLILSLSLSSLRLFWPIQSGLLLFCLVTLTPSSLVLLGRLFLLCFTSSSYLDLA